MSEDIAICSVRNVDLSERYRTRPSTHAKLMPSLKASTSELPPFPCIET